VTDKKLSCIYCDDGGSVKPIRQGKLYYCAECETYYANCPEMLDQLAQAARRQAKRVRAEFH